MVDELISSSAAPSETSNDLDEHSLSTRQLLEEIKQLEERFECVRRRVQEMRAENERMEAENALMRAEIERRRTENRIRMLEQERLAIEASNGSLRQIVCICLIILPKNVILIKIDYKEGWPMCLHCPGNKTMTWK